MPARSVFSSQRHPRLTVLAHSLALACGIVCMATAPDVALATTDSALAATSAPPGGVNIVVQNCNDAGPGSLREAAQVLALSGDTIDLTQLACSTITLSTGAIAFGIDNLDIVGPGSPVFIPYGATGRSIAISGDDRFPIFQHVGSGTLRLSGLAATDGYKYSDTDSAPGGCIHSQGSVVLDRASVGGCVARTSGPDAAEGGGLYVRGDLLMSDSLVSGNNAIAEHGNAFGGGASVGGTLRSKYSVFAGNEAHGGDNGGSGAFGAAVARGDASIVGSCIFSNSADDVGGLGLLGTHASSPLSVRNSTIAANVATGLSAAAGLIAGSELVIANSTIAGNVLSIDPAPIPGAAAGMNLAAHAQIVSSIIARNSIAIDGAPEPIASDLGGVETSVDGSHNLIGASTLALPADTLRSDPLLVLSFSPVRTRHGFTFLLAFANPASPAVDAGSNPFSLVTDQRGAPYRRVEGVATDIGAFELDGDRIFYDGFE